MKVVAGLRFEHVHLRAGSARLTLSGELDVVTAARASARLRRAQDESRVLICDVGELWFVDLTGLRVLLDAAAYAERSGRRLIVANAPAVVPRMLRLLRLEHALEVPATPLPARTFHGCAVIRPHVTRRAHARKGEIT